MHARRIFAIQPTVRVVGLALPSAKASASRSGVWMCEETLSLFAFHTMPAMTDRVKADILCTLCPE